MNEQFVNAIREALGRDATLDELIAVVREHKVRGLAQRDCYEVLLGMRDDFGEAIEDRILDVLDVVAGWCSPHRYIWPAPLKLDL